MFDEELLDIVGVLIFNFVKSTSNSLDDVSSYSKLSIPTREQFRALATDISSQILEYKEIDYIDDDDWDDIDDDEDEW